MIIKNHNFVSVQQYAAGMGKTQQLITRYIRQERELPGIKAIFKISERVFVLEKDKNYNAVCKAASARKYYFSEVAK